MAMDRDSTRNTLLVTIGLSVACALVISVSAVGLRPRQEANAAESIRRSILEAAGLYDPLAPEETDVNAAFEKIETKTVDLSSGAFIDPSENPELAGPGYDQLAAARDPELSVAIDRSADIAGIGRREKASRVYLLRDDAGALDQVVLPVYGKGLFSTLYGFVSLGPDLQTVQGITFYQHGETPGLGAEVDNPAWKAKWPGKSLGSDRPGGEVALRLVKGSADGPQEIDGLSGATLTSNGVTALVQYWLGPEGFGPFLEKLGAGAGAGPEPVSASARAEPPGGGGRKPAVMGGGDLG